MEAMLMRLTEALEENTAALRDLRAALLEESGTDGEKVEDVYLDGTRVSLSQDAD